MKKIYLLALLPLAAPAAPERLNPQERLRPPHRAAYAAPTPLPLLPPAHFNNGIHFTPRPTPTVLYFDAQGQPAATASAGGYRRHIVGQTKDGLLVAQDFYQDSDSPQTAPFLLSPGHEADFGEAGLNGRVYSYRPDGRLQSATTYQRGQRIGWRYWSDGERYVFAESNGPKAVQVLLDEQGHTQIWREPTQTLYFYPAGNALARAVGSHWQYWGPDGGPLRPLSPLQPQPEGLVHHQLLLQQYRQLQAVRTLMAPANSQSAAASANRTTGGSASASGAANDVSQTAPAGHQTTGPAGQGSASTAGANQSVEQSASASATAPDGAHRLAATPSASTRGSASSSEAGNQTATAGQVAEGSASVQNVVPTATQNGTAPEPGAAVGANQTTGDSASAREVSQTATAEGSAAASAPQRGEATASALEAGQMAAAGNQTAPAGQSASVVANQAAEGSASAQNASPTPNPAAAVATVAQQLPDSIAPRAGVDPATASAAGVPPAEPSPAPTPDVGVGEVVAVLREENPPAEANPAPSAAAGSASVQNASQTATQNGAVQGGSASVASQTTTPNVPVQEGSASASEASQTATGQVAGQSASVQNASQTATQNGAVQGRSASVSEASQTVTAGHDARQTATADNQTATAGQSASVQTNASAGANQTAAGSASAQNAAAGNQGSASVSAPSQTAEQSVSTANAGQMAAANQTAQGSASVVEVAHQAAGQSASAPNPAPAVVDGDDDDSTLPELQALGVDGRAPHLAEMVASLRLPTATSLTGELQPFRDLYTVRANDYQSPLAYQPAPTKTVYAFDSQGQPLASNQGAAYFRELLGSSADGWSVVRDYYANGAPQTAPYRLPPGSERVFRHSPAEGLLLVFGPDGTVKTVGNFSRGVPVGWLNTVAQERISSASLYHGSQRRALLQYDSREQPWRLLSGDRLVYFYPDGQPLAEFIATRRRPVSLWNRDGSPRPLSAWPDNRDPDEVAAQLRQQP